MSDLKTQLRTYFEATTAPSGSESAPAEALDLALTSGRRGVARLDPAPVRPVPWWRRPVVAAAAILVVAAVALGSVWIGSGSENVAPANEPDGLVVPDAPRPTGPDAGRSSADSEQEARRARAVAVVDRVYEAYERGDIEAIAALLAQADVTGYTSIEGFAWDLAQGTQVSDRSCDVSSEATAINVTCSMEYQTALGRAAGAAPIELIATATVSSQDEITFFNERLSVPDEVESLTDSFEDWVSTTHPEDAELVRFGRWESVGEARRGGELRSRYVAEYAQYLAENGCTFQEPCVP